MQGIYYDFYGNLLTEHQRKIYEDVALHDMSLGEIAQEMGISRQAVFDLVKRCDKLLQSYEDKLKLVQKFKNTSDLAAQIGVLARRCREENNIELTRKIEELAALIPEME